MISQCIRYSEKPMGRCVCVHVCVLGEVSVRGYAQHYIGGRRHESSD